MNNKYNTIYINILNIINTILEKNFKHLKTMFIYWVVVRTTTQ